MRLAEILKEKGIPGLRIALKAGIAPGDFYQAIHGKRPFFPAWRHRIAAALDMPEETLFPEYVNKEA